MNSANDDYAFNVAASLFKSIPGFKDADMLAEQCIEHAEVCRKDVIYLNAHSQMIGEEVDGYEAAIRTFQTISGWKDSDKLIYTCRQKIEEIKARKEAERLELERKVEQTRIAEEKAAKKL